ncbi:MAG: hypothetical protein SOT81_07335 [Treponema sp.]|nr:hypothetical protein [Treponema sp.]
MPEISLSPSLRLAQRTSQNQKMAQTQKMSQTQIMSLKLLNMSSGELRNEIYEKAAKNPALVVTEDKFQDGDAEASNERQNSNLSKNHFSDSTFIGKATASGIQASDNFQAALENNEDFREPLADHLEHQLNSMNLSKGEQNLCKKLIYNLDKNGFNILAPEALIDKNAPKSEQTPEFLLKCKNIVQNLDPVGTCTNNFEESLFVQAKIKGNASACTLFLLNHFEYLNPPQTAKIKKKIENYFKENEKLQFNTNFRRFEHDEEDIEESLDFIKKLDPFPARNFGTSQTNFVIPDVKIEEIKNPDDENENPEFRISLSRESRPKIEVAKDYENLVNETKIADGDVSEQAERQKAEVKFARNSINDAKIFIESIEYRESTILKSCKVIAEVQKNFLMNGPKFLAPLRQKDVAEKIGVHEATISRMANSKFVQCKWGIFPISYFFTNAVGDFVSKKTNSKISDSKKSLNSKVSDSSESDEKFLKYGTESKKENSKIKNSGNEKSAENLGESSNIQKKENETTNVKKNAGENLNQNRTEEKVSNGNSEKKSSDNSENKNSVSKSSQNFRTAQNAGAISKEAVKAQIAELLEEHKNDKKAPSDQKISDMLAEKGIKIARRTVAKYRAELNISSSYER